MNWQSAYKLKEPGFESGSRLSAPYAMWWSLVLVIDT